MRMNKTKSRHVLISFLIVGSAERVWVHTENQLLRRGEHVQRECHLILVFLQLKPPDKLLKIRRLVFLADLDFGMVRHAEGNGWRRHDAIGGLLMDKRWPCDGIQRRQKPIQMDSCTM